MSERGSWISSYLHCQECSGIIRRHLLPRVDEKSFTLNILAHGRKTDNSDNYASIWGGRIGGGLPREEIRDFTEYLTDMPRLCHHARFVVHAEQASALFAVNPWQPLLVLLIADELYHAAALQQARAS